MSEEISIDERLNIKAIAWDVCCVLGIIAAIVFALLWLGAESEQSESAAKVQQAEKKITELNQRLGITETELSDSAEKFDKNYKSATSELANKVQTKDETIAALKTEVEKLNAQRLQAETRWRTPLKDALAISQDIYAMKWQSNSHVLNDMENHSARTVTICEKWEELCQKLAPYPEMAPEIAKLRIRLAQAYSGLGIIGRINFEKIDWKAAEMEAERPKIEAHVWFSVATQFAKAGKLEEAKKYLASARASTEKIAEDPKRPEQKEYYLAMMHLLEANIAASNDPDVALKNYIAASEKLSTIITAVPTNTKLHTAFIQACLDGAMLSEGGTSAGQADALRKKAYSQINKLIEKNPKIEKPHLLYAELKTLEAEQLLRDGEQYKASKVLDQARAAEKKGGSDVLVAASIDGIQAFIHWDHGERTKAIKIIDGAINRVKNFKESEPNNHEADYRLASLYWVKSSMRIKPNDAILDGQTAVKYLVELVQKGAGKREASARRMIAIIYGDIGHQAYSTNQKKVAKQYFEQAQKQWLYLAKNWGECDEYKEGQRWCSWRIKSL